METVRLGTLRIDDAFEMPLTGRIGQVMPVITDCYEPGCEPWIDEDNGISVGVLVYLGPDLYGNGGYLEKVLHPDVRVYPVEEG